MSHHPYGMKKGRDYQRLENAALPIPDHGVYDESCLHDPQPSLHLTELVRRILDSGSGLIGLRTEPKENASPLGNYPHIMPLLSEDEVRSAMERVLETTTGISWWFLVNEAFTEYKWNAVVMATSMVDRPGSLSLIGEVNQTDNLPLREAMAKTENCVSITKWKHQDLRWLRSAILKSALVDEWLEVSSVHARGRWRTVFWGMR